MKYIENKLNANIVKLKDTKNNYTSDNVEGALEEIDSKIKNIENNGYDDTQIKQDIVNIKTEIGTEELTTTDQTIKGAVNEIDSQINAIVNVGDLGKNGDNVYIKDSNGNKIGNGITISSEFNNINDTTTSASTTYSSNKIESIKGELNSQITTIENNMQNIGNPTDEQVKNAINEAITNGDIVVGGLTSTAQTLLINILRSAVFTTDQSANIALLQSELAKGNSGGSSGGGSETTQYVITNTLNNATTSNSAVLVDANASYTATISINDGYTLDTITVTMGGTDITNTAVSGTTITISAVTGNVVITVTTIQQSSPGGTGSIINTTWRNGSISTTTGEVLEATTALSDFIDVTQINTLKVSTVNTNWCSVNFYVYTSNSYDTYVDSTPHQGSDLYIQANSDTRKDHTIIDVSTYNYIIIKLSTSTADEIAIEVID